MNGRPTASSRIFLALGTLVAASASAAEGAASPYSSLSRHAGSLLAGGVLAGALLLVFAAGVLKRRPWARPAAILLFAGTGAAAIAGAVFQLSARRGAVVPADAAEIGSGPLLSLWRKGGAVAALLHALFCAASLRRFTSKEMRREFSGEPRRPL
ncbi:MAG: hypothetical protein ABR610_02570 [Thermoanaerobaculia bacterium]